MSDEISTETTADLRVPLAEEHVTVTKREVTTGRVVIKTLVETVQEMARADLRSEIAEVTRVPLDQLVSGAVPDVRQEGEVTIVPVFEEVLVVEKRLILKEEIHIRRRSTVEAIEEAIPVRRQSAQIERLNADEDGAEVRR